MAILDISDAEVEIEDRVVSSQSLELTLFLDVDLEDTITNLTQTFVSLADAAATFAATTKIYKALDAHYKQPGHNTTTKVGRVTNGDASITASLDALWDEDKDWFTLITTTKNETIIDTIADWCAGKNIVYFFSTEFDATKLNAASVADIASSLSALNYNNVGAYCHHQCGVDAASITVTVASGIVTFASTAHGLRVGDDITPVGHSDSSVNINATVATVADANTFTILATGADDDADGEAISYFARYKFIESALQSAFFSNPIGSDTAAYISLVGQVAIPKTLLTDSQVQVLRSKHYNTYLNPYNNISITADGLMVTGRQIKDQVVAAWLDVNIEAETFQIVINDKPSYTNTGAQQVAAGVIGPLDTQLSRGGLNPLNNTQPYTIVTADALTASAANRQAGIYPEIVVTARVGSTILKTSYNVKLLV